MGDETLLVALLGGLHLLGLGFGAVLLLPLLRDERIVPRAHGEEEDDGGGGGNDRVDPAPPRRPRGGWDPALPLPHAVPARVRLREPARLADLIPARGRREHAPAPVRTPVRGR
jgi:hypothetical protein